MQKGMHNVINISEEKTNDLQRGDVLKSYLDNKSTFLHVQFLSGNPLNSADLSSLACPQLVPPHLQLLPPAPLPPIPMLL